MAELEKCGEDIACQTRVTQKMMQNPKVQADVQKAKNAGEALGKGSPRYQVWIVDRKTPATGTVKMEVGRDQLFKTAVDERETCSEIAEIPFGNLMRGVTWPARIKIDAQAGIYAANIGGRLGLVWYSRDGELFSQGRNTIMAVQVTKGTPLCATTRLFDHVGSKFLIPDWNISPDGKRFLVAEKTEASSPLSQINIITNWFEELKARVPTDKQ